MIQLTLFDSVPQPRRKRPENERVYSAILYLRSAEAKVYRGGRDIHLVDGARITTSQLIQLAGA